MPRKHVRWSGILKEPIGPMPTTPKRGALAKALLGHDEDAWEVSWDSPAGRRWSKAYVQRVHALAVRYGVHRDPIEGIWKSLFENLAREAVPGFSEDPRRKGGAKPKVNNPDAKAAREHLLALVEHEEDRQRSKKHHYVQKPRTAILKDLSNAPSKLHPWFRSKRRGARSLANAVNLALAERAEREATKAALARMPSIGLFRVSSIYDLLRTGPLGFPYLRTKPAEEKD